MHTLALSNSDKHTNRKPPPLQ